MLSTHTDLKEAWLLAQRFLLLLHQHRSDELADWFRQVAQSGLTTFRRFAQGLQQEEGALRAAFSLPFSNGVVEGSVNKLKLLKRQMFGRAGFALLRQWLLHAP